MKALGITMNSSEDVFAICTGTENTVLPMTKRNVLKKIAGVFDPLGFLAPFLMKGKILLKNCGPEALIGMIPSRMVLYTKLKRGSNILGFC